MFAKLISTLVLIALTPTIAMADASTFCFWGIVTESHAQMEICGDRLSPDHEANYVILRSAIETFIVENAKVNAQLTRQSIRAGFAASDLRYRTMLANDPHLKTTTCAGADYPDAKKVLDRMTEPTTLDQILARLKVPKDPFDGECI
jgi:hypothetical protein